VTTSASSNATAGTTGTGAKPTGASSSGARQSLCAFWLGGRCFGLDVALAFEVVVVDTITPVPKAHGALLGLFNLRGTPVPLVDAASVLALAGRAPSKETCALVLRHGDLIAALAIDRMEAVIEAGRGAFTPPAAGDEHPVVRGFLEMGDRVVTVIAPEVLLERLQRLRPETSSRR
jgi:purine-binding chemotaxis protein CheW